MKAGVVSYSTLAKYNNWSPDYYLNNQSAIGANDKVTKAVRRLVQAKKALKQAKDEHEEARTNVLEFIERGELQLITNDPAFMRWPLEKYYNTALRVTNFVERFFQRSGCTNWPTFRQITQALKTKGLTYACLIQICEDCSEGMLYNSGEGVNGGIYEYPTKGEYTLEITNYEMAEEHWTWKKAKKKRES